MLAMDSSAPRLSGLRALSLTTIAGKPAPTRDRETYTPCRSRLAGDGLEYAAFIRFTRVIVNDYRWQASSYTGPRDLRTCRSRLAGDGLECAAFIRFTSVIVNDHHWQASSYTGPRDLRAL